MEKASIYSLPVELHTIILKLLYSSRQSIRKPERSRSSLDSYIPIENEAHDPSLFPYNVATAWKVWRNILTGIPECWSRIVFDVARNPELFLEAFAWAKDAIGIQVVVFNSSQIEDMTSAEELRHMWPIFRAVMPHVPRCKSIVYNTLYSSSLPPPTMFLLQEAPHLEELSLECIIDNIDLNKVQPVTRKRLLCASFPKLSTLSLTGFWFFYLIYHAKSGLL
ncbi:hypothetical protein CVT26_013030 [Gymnopilus dilepis]|uniref:F-box domain-containing protein n=1 Tax=Gymnopilus dilepis TaxID=231916 RepID=A0A409Y4I2_9AGAR|nr:hypothetical protein CVT26_013030 [Gymnopilus dilepis]